MKLQEGPIENRAEQFLTEKEIQYGKELLERMCDPMFRQEYETLSRHFSSSEGMKAYYGQFLDASKVRESIDQLEPMPPEAFPNKLRYDSGREIPYSPEEIKREMARIKEEWRKGHPESSERGEPSPLLIENNFFIRLVFLSENPDRFSGSGTTHNVFYPSIMRFRFLYPSLAREIESEIVNSYEIIEGRSQRVWMMPWDKIVVAYNHIIRLVDRRDIDFQTGYTVEELWEDRGKKPHSLWYLSR